jgi:hypothetical protein
VHTQPDGGAIRGALADTVQRVCTSVESVRSLDERTVL